MAMVYLTAGLALVGAMAALNLLLTVGVIRRLRQHSGLLAGRRAAGIPEPGDRIGQFTARGVDGQTVSRDALGPDHLAVFLSPGCRPCEEQLPALVAYLRDSGRDRSATLAVVAAGAEVAAGMIGELEPLATVVCEPSPDSQLQAAFGVAAFPVALAINADRVAAVFPDLTRLPASADLATSAS